MFLLKLDFPSGNCVREEECFTLLVNISLKGVSSKDNQALEPNLSTGLQPIKVFGALLDANEYFPHGRGQPHMAAHPRDSRRLSDY